MLSFPYDNKAFSTDNEHPGIVINRVFIVRFCLLFMILFMNRTAMALNENIIANSGFERGLENWNIAGHKDGTARVVREDDEEHGILTAIELDATRILHGSVGLLSDPQPVASLASYRLSWHVRRIAGSGYRTIVNVIWLDENKQSLPELNVVQGCYGVAVGSTWQAGDLEIIAPEDARFAKVNLGVEMGPDEKNICRFSKINLCEIPPLRKASLAIDILSEPLAPENDDPVTLTVRIENRGDLTAERIRAEVRLPEGMTACTPLDFAADRLSFGQSIRKCLKVSGYPRDNSDTIQCRLETVMDGRPRNFEQGTRPFISIAARREQQTGLLSAPTKPAMQVKLGCYYFPGMMVWDSLKKNGVEYLKPVLGYYNEELPETADWHIQWAVSHGISFFAFDWFWNQGHEFINKALDEGFLKSRFTNSMEFCIYWCNADSSNHEYHPLDFSDATLTDLMETFSRRYFHLSNYLRVEGKPVLIIFMPAKLANADGGWEQCARKLDMMREIARRHGHPGLYIVALQDDPYIADYGKGGFDAVSTYTYGYNRRWMPYETQLPYLRECYETARQKAHQQQIDYIPAAWVGWDDIGWAGRDQNLRTIGNTPAAFRRNVEALPDFVEPDTRLAMVEAWNEWGEGSVIEPEIRYQFGYLGAIRDALGIDARGPYSIPVPGPGDLKKIQASLPAGYFYDTYYRPYAESIGLHNGFHMDFESNRSLWMRVDPGGDARNARIENGCLRVQSIGSRPVLVGPPFMGLDADHVDEIHLRMSVSAGTRGRLQWRNQNQKNWTDENSLDFDMSGDGEMHAYLLKVGENPAWSGLIDEIRLLPGNAASEIRIDDMRTSVVRLPVQN